MHCPLYWKYKICLCIISAQMCASVTFFSGFCLQLVFLLSLNPNFFFNYKRERERERESHCYTEVTFLSCATPCRFFHLCTSIMVGWKEERGESLQNNLLHHPDTWLTPCGKPQWQMLRVRVKGKVLGNDMWNRGQTVEPPALQMYSTAPEWTDNTEQGSVETHCLREFGEGGFLWPCIKKKKK